MSYQLFMERSAQMTLAGISRADRELITQAVRSLGDEPRPAGSRKLSGRDAWRIRVGVYRVIYEVQDDRLIVMVLQIGHRREIYRR